MTVGPSGPLLLNGTIRTESLRLLRFLSSRETISTQWRMGGLPKVAVQISPRRGSGLLVKVDSRCTLRERRLKSSLLRRLFVGHVGKIRSRVVRQPFAILINQELPYSEVNSLSQRSGLAPSDRIFQRECPKRSWLRSSSWLAGRVSPSCPPVIGYYIRVLSGIKLQSQLHYRRPRSALVLRRLGDRLNMWMLLQELAQRFAQDAHAAAVNYAHARHSGEECAVHESFHFARGVVHGASDHVDLGGNALAFALHRD